MRAFLNKCVWIEETIIAYTLIAMVVLSFINVILRRLFNSGLFWSLETVLFLFLIFVLFGMSYTARKSLHIGIDIIVNLFPSQQKKYITIAACLISSAYAFLIAFAAYGIFYKYYRIPALRKVQLEDIPVPIWLVYALMIFCFCYLGMTLIYCSYEIIQNKRQSITSAHEAEE